MSEGISAFPLAWPAGFPRTPAYQREAGQFKGTLDRVRRELLDEVNAIVLGADARHFTIRNHVVISTNMPVRNDGGIYASAREPADPGVAVYFTRKKVRVCLACDKYDRVWKNLRALQKSIEAMRGIERWGSTQLLDRAFTGFAALPEKTGPGFREILGILPDAVLTEETILAAFRAKAKTTHPDAGGSHEAFAQLSQAKDIALATVKGGGR